MRPRKPGVKVVQILGGVGNPAVEAREVTSMARRIAALLALETQLDENYRRVKDGAVGLK